MKLIDLNILSYAVDESAPKHSRARAWVEQALQGPETVALPWVVLLGFLRLSTHHAVFEQPLTVDEAFDVVAGWLQVPAVTVVQETPRHFAVLRQLLAPLGTAGNLTTDAHLAALAVEHGAELFSGDADFSRFPGVRWSDPLRD